MVNFDAVAKPLADVLSELKGRNLQYLLRRTSPKRRLDALEERELFVIRQQIDAQGIYHLTVAAKMKKE
jgi:hypothetical protein